MTLDASKEEQALEAIDRSVILLVAVAILSDGKVLLVREEAQPYNGKWVLPQGYVRRNETLDGAARREVWEELRIRVEVEGIVGLYEDFVQENREMFHYVVVCCLAKTIGLDEIHATSEVIDWVWKDPSKSVEQVPLIVQKMLKDVSRVSRRKKGLFLIQHKSAI